MKRVAIPVSEGKLSEYFSCSDHYEIFNLEGGRLLRDEKLAPPSVKVSELPEWASSNKITDIITHRIDNSIISMFVTRKINLFIGVSMNTPLAIIEDYMNGKLQSSEDIIFDLNK